MYSSIFYLSEGNFYKKIRINLEDKCNATPTGQDRTDNYKTVRAKGDGVKEVDYNKTIQAYIILPYLFITPIHIKIKNREGKDYT